MNHHIMNRRRTEKTLQDISPQVPSMLLAKCLGLKYCINNLLDFILAQATTSQLESEVTNLKSRLEFQESELEKANSKFEFSVSEQDKLKKNFETEKKAWADEKTALKPG